jgi:predicted Fe-S protein YdhL (DUF1289 family)
MDSSSSGGVSLVFPNPDSVRHPESTMTADRSPPSSDPASPCVGVCIINAQTQLCDGCFRTLDEIAAWWDYPPAQKHAVLATLEQRLARIMDGTFFD